MQRIAIVGGGWAGLSAAVHAAQKGHQVHLFEASTHWGGRARSQTMPTHQGVNMHLDNGQHLLLGAYDSTLSMLQTVGVDVDQAFFRHPLSIQYPNGTRIQWPRSVLGIARQPYVEALWGLLCAKGWSWADRWAFAKIAQHWKRHPQDASIDISVTELCQHVPPSIYRYLIEPLCISALNTPAHRASSQVFLRVLNDALWQKPGGCDMLIPRIELTPLFADCALHWLHKQAQGHSAQLGHRITSLACVVKKNEIAQWLVNEQAFDQVVWTPPPSPATLRIMNQAVDSMPTPDQTLASTWRSTAKNLAFESIGTVYANAMHPIQMPSCGAWALHANSQCPAQFVFHHPSIAHNSHTQQGQNLLAFVVSACHLDVETLTHQVIHQAALQLGWHITPVKTILEKRATFACSPGLKRPPATIAPKLWAAGDWVQGPYPATIEGAIRSALALDFEASAPN